jgi:hypothetical protein
MSGTSPTVIAVLALAGALLFAQSQAPLPDLTGTWSGQTQMSRGKNLFTLVLARTGESYSGTTSHAMGLLNQVPIQDVKYSDGTLRFSFKASLASRDLQLEATLRLEDGRLVGVWTAESGDTSSLDLERKGTAPRSQGCPLRCRREPRYRRRSQQPSSRRRALLPPNWRRTTSAASR